MRTVIITMLSISGLFLACEARESRVSPKASRKLLPKVVHDVDHIPTNPEGGTLPDKRPQLSAEENARRQALNASAPLVWGESVAGISFSTTQSASEAILANPTQIYEEDGRYIYPEFIHVFWEGEKELTPGLILVWEGYKGTITLPEPYKSLELGTNYKNWLAKEEDRSALIQAIGATFAGKPAPYNCLEQLDCSIDQEADGGFSFNFAKGYMVFDKDQKLFLMVMFPEARKLPSTEAYVYGESMVGVKLSDTREQIESRFGAPENTEVEYGIYDRGNLAAFWDEAGAVGTLVLLQSSKGPIPGPQGIAKMGDSAESLVPATDDGKELTLLFDRHFEKRAEGYNCLEAKPEPTCAFEMTPDSLDVYLQKAMFRFSPDAKRILFQIQMSK